MTKEELGTDGDYRKTYSNDDSSYYWNERDVNTWSKAPLNTTNLNTNFINYLGTEWANKIATTTWKVGGNTGTNLVDVIPSITYQNEIVSPASEAIFEAKIGLMYVSDYGFAASPSAWTLTMSSYNNTTATNNNWMYMGYYSEWTISRNADNEYAGTVIINGNGNVLDDVANLVLSEENSAYARATFNLESINQETEQ